MQPNIFFAPNIDRGVVLSALGVQSYDRVAQ